MRFRLDGRAVVDLVVWVAALGVAVVARHGFQLHQVDGLGLAVVTVVAVSLQLGAGFASGLYRGGRTAGGTDETTMAAIVTAVVAAAVLGVDAAVRRNGSRLVPIIAVAGAGVVALTGSVAIRYGATRARHRVAALWRGHRLGVLVVAVPVLVNAGWVVSQRRGQPLDIDEAGYIGMSMRDYLGLTHAGVHGWWHEVVVQPVQAPLAPALASVLHWVTGPRVLNAFVVSLLAYGVLLATTLGITRGWPRFGRFLAVLIVGLAPLLLAYSRSFNFAELASACLAAALYFGHRSDGFSRTGASVAWGVCVGLMVLARTMTVAFVPALLVAALLPALARRSPSSLLRVGLGMVVAVAVASTWYAHNLHNVYDYLRNFGYGAEAGEYALVQSPFSLHGLYVFAVVTLNYFHAGLSALVLAGWVAAAAVVLRGAGPARPVRTFVGRMLVRLSSALKRGSPVVACAVVTTGGLAALLTSRNKGTGFVAPLSVPVAVVAAWGLARATTSTSFRRAIAAVVAVALAAPSAVLSLLPLSIVATVVVPLPPPGRLLVLDSRSTLANYEHTASVSRAGGVSKARGREWLAAAAFVDDELWAGSRRLGRPAVVVFAFRHTMVNLNTVTLDSMLRFGTEPVALQVNPVPGESDPARVLAQLPDIDGRVTMVATATPGPDEFRPALPAGTGALYVSRLHLEVQARRRLPDGRWLTLWTARP